MIDVIKDWILSETNLFIKGLTLPVILGAGYFGVRRLYGWYKNYLDQKNLFPYYSRKILSESRKNYIRTKCQNIDPANEVNYYNSFAFATREDLLKFFLKKVLKIKNNENRFYLLLADSGMGKSTFLLNLYSRYKSWLHINLNKKDVKLFPLGENFDKTTENICSIENKTKTILLLDGFDEIPAQNNVALKNKFDKVINLCQDFAIVIITCRTHFFSSEKDEPFELKIRKYNPKGNGFHVIKKLYISPFDKRDINKYIKKIFPFWAINNKKKAREIIRSTNDLMVRPMLLSYIKDIITSRHQELSTNFDIYESLILRWVERESLKYEHEKRKEFQLNLVYFSFAVCDYIYNNYHKNGIYIPLSVATELSQQFEINLSEIEIKSRSLLNRNSNGDYKFSHKSIYEFFLSYNAYVQRRVFNERNNIKYNLENYDVAKGFIEDIVTSKKHKFLLPKFVEEETSLNEELYYRILLIRNDRATVRWVSGASFVIEKQAQELANI